MRVLSYNILIGGTRRIEKLAKIIAATDADIVGLVEATDASVVEQLAQKLQMQHCISGRGRHNRDWQVALLSRYPIVATKVHTYPAVLARRHMLEATLEEPGGQQFTVFVIHLTADFYSGMASVHKRRDEIRLALALMSAKGGTPHLLMGDFNSIVPGEPVYGSKLLRYQLHQREQYYKQIAAIPHFRVQHKAEMTLRSYLLRPLVRFALHNGYLSAMIDRIGVRYAQGGFDLLREAGYVDCFRVPNPDEPGFTCPSAALSGRIDYIFASPELAPRLTFSEVISEGNGVRGEEASDHLPVLAEFDMSQ
jgi:endonuclease/exonuclease/phosphatase family metal-dependent hydrolase